MKHSKKKKKIHVTVDLKEATIKTVINNFNTKKFFLIVIKTLYGVHGFPVQMIDSILAKG